MQRPNSETTALADILMTEELSRRASRVPDWQAEAEAMRSLGWQMAQASENLLQTLVDMALELCQAGTAGVSLLDTLDGAEIFRWAALAGTLSPFAGRSTSRHSPCGTCLEQGSPVLVSHPERYFTDFQAINTPIVEGLVLPIVADHHALGTLWIMSHDEGRQFDSEDVRVMTSLADFTATALLLQQRQTGELLAANVVLETEITDIKQTEARLSEAQRRLELSLKGANLGTWTYRVATDEFWADDRALTLQGHAPGEAKTFAEAGMNIHPDDYDRAQAAFAAALQTRSNLQMAYRVIWRDDSVHWISSYAELVAVDGGTFYGVVQDITASKRKEIEQLQTETVLRQTEARLRVLIQNLPGGAAFVVDRDLRYLLAEGESLAIAGFKPEDFVGRTIFEALPPELAAHYEPMYRQALAGEPFEHEHHAHDHTYISRGTPLRADNGEIYAVLAVSYDITERKRIESERNRREEQQEYLLRLSDALRPLSDAAEIEETACRLLGEYLGVNRAYYVELNEAAGYGKVEQQYLRDGASSLAGTYKLSDFSWTLPFLRRDETIVVSNIYRTDLIPPTDVPMMEAVEQVAILLVPVVKGGELMGTLAVSEIEPRVWQDEEIELARETLERMWATAQRARAERALRESEAKYRSLFESIDEGYLLCEVIFDENEEPIDILYLEANPAAIRLAGRDFSGRRMREIDPNYEDYWYELIGRVALTGESVRAEHYAEPHGRWFDFYASRVGGPESRRVVSIFQDTTVAKHLEEGRKRIEDDRKRQEEALRESEERLRDVLNSMSEGFALLGGDFTILDVNEETLRLDGRSRQELIGCSHWEAFPGSEDSAIGEIFKRVARERISASLEHEYRWPDGRSMWIDMRAYPTRDAGVAIFWRDITDRKQAEADLRESEERLQKAISIETVGVLFFTLDGRITDANDTFLRMSGYSRDELRNIRDWHDLTPPEFRDVTSCVAEELATLGKTAPYEKQHLRQDGSRWWGLFAPTRLKGSGRNAECVEFVIDISEAKRVEDERKRAEAQLRRAAEMDAFRVKLADALRLLTDPVQIQAEACRLLGEQLGVDRAFYVEIYEAEGYARVNQHYSRGDSPSIVGDYPLAGYGWSMQMMRRGETIVVADTQSSNLVPDHERAAMAMLQMVGFVALPLIKGEVLVGALTLNEPTPREWTEAEVDLVRETAERIWADIQRAHAETALRQSEEKYRTLFDSIDEGLAIVEMIYDDQGEIVDIIFRQVNRAYERQGGVYDVVGRSIFDVIPGVEDYWLDLYKRVAKMGESVREENYQQDVDRWFDVYFSRVDDTGRFVAIVFSDISDRKRREMMLRENQERQAFLLKLSDILQRFVQPNDIKTAAMRLLGEHLGVSRAQYHECDSNGEYYSADGVGYANGLPLLDLKYRIDNFGTFVNEDFAAGRPYRIDDLEFDPRVSAAERDAYRTYQIRAGAGVPLIRGGKLVAILAVHDVHPHEWTDLEMDLIRETAERIWTPIERARAQAALREAELQRVREQSAREQERQRAESLAELDRAKTLFFSNVSHEFRTPLTLSLAPLQDVLSDRTHPLEPVHRERLELVHRNSLRLLKLVNTLLDFSRIEAGRMEAVYEPTDLATFTTELASVFRSAIERAGLQLIVDCPPLPEPVFVDREMWEKIVLNLLSNAFKFTFEGEIRVSLRSTDRNQAILQIQDTGTGIAPEHLPHLFERFYQVRSTQARTHEGSGIGLALVHELVRLQGGTIEVNSTVGAGTCFTIALPFGTDHLPSDRLHLEGDRPPIRTLSSTAMGATAYVEEAERWLPTQENREHRIENVEEQTVQTADSSLSTNTSARVLVVDDNADMRKYLTRILSEHVQVEAVADGITALAVVQERVPDLILSDVMMPGLDGFELLSALRADPRTQEVPIILLSARAGEEAIVEGLAAGADDYLIKPFSAQELVSRVTAHLQMAQLRGAALQHERAMNQQKDQLLSTVSHELNTPLVAILGWTRLLRSSLPNPLMLSKALDTIERNATLQAKLVQDLLDISRITVGKLRLHRQPVALPAIIETALASVTQTAAAKGVHLIWQNPTHGSPALEFAVLADSERLQQVFCNLLTNAIKFTPAGGCVTVELVVKEGGSAAWSPGNEVCQTSEVCRTSEQDGKIDHPTIAPPASPHAQIIITDTGIGIPADCLPHVFDRFWQAKGSTSVKGLGLGLTIARHLVELHNGTIQAESAGEEQGATFIVRLPLIPSLAPPT